MTAKEKAKELIEKLTLSSNAQDGSWMCEDLAKRCALIAVDEILRSHHNLYGLNNKEVKFYLEVQQEIEEL